MRFVNFYGKLILFSMRQIAEQKFSKESKINWFKVFIFYTPIKQGSKVHFEAFTTKVIYS